MMLFHIYVYGAFCNFTFQAKLKSLEAQLNVTLQSKTSLDSNSTKEDIESTSVSKKLEEELQKRDALIEVN